MTRHDIIITYQLNIFRQKGESYNEVSVGANIRLPVTAISTRASIRPALINRRPDMSVSCVLKVPRTRPLVKVFKSIALVQIR